MIPREILEKPYQPYGDSPTIKSYTLWSLYDEYYKELARGEIGIGGDSPVPEGYDVVLAGTGIMSTKFNVSKTQPLGIINPRASKPLEIHYYLLRNAYRLTLSNTSIRVASTIPDQKSITPQHLVVNVSGKTSILLDILGDSSRSLRSLVVEVNVEPNSILDLVVIARDTLFAPSLIVVGVRGEEYSTIKTTYYVRPGVMTRLEIKELLDGRGAEAYTRGIVVSRNNERLDNIVDLINRGADTYSHHLFTALLYGDSIVAQRGTGKIASSAVNAGVEYYSEGLIRSPNALFIGQPRLEIDTGNVRVARHAARNTHILPEQVFYLQTRGIDRMRAELMITEGFLLRGIISRYAEEVIKPLIVGELRKTINP